MFESFSHLGTPCTFIDFVVPQWQEPGADLVTADEVAVKGVPGPAV